MQKQQNKGIHNKCDYCDKIYKIKGNLIAHIIKCHSTNGKHQCKQCATILPNIQTLKQHMKSAHITHACIECNKFYKYRNSLYAHNRIKHHCLKDGKQPVELKRLVCEICGYRTRISCNLIVHKRRHTGERPYCCDTCGKCFTALYQLNAHKEIHAENRLHKCLICNVAFYQRKALLHHRTLHLKNKKFICQMCDKSYTQASGLSQHKRWHKLQNERSTSLIHLEL